jgi:hypothetical protein
MATMKRARRARGFLRIRPITIIWVVATCALATSAPIAGAESPQHELLAAIQQALAQHSSDVDVSISIGVRGTSITVVREVGMQTFNSPLNARFTTSVLDGSTGKTTSVPTLIVGTHVYLQVDGIWYYTTTSAIEAEIGVSGSLQSENPTEALGLLYQEGAVVTDLGHQTLDGATMTKYRAVVDLDKRFKTPHGISATPQYVARFKKLTGSSKLPVSVWVDSSGIVRQERFTVPLSTSGLKAMGLTATPKGMSMTMTLDLSNFGVRVSVKPPATAKPLPAASGSSSAT